MVLSGIGESESLNLRIRTFPERLLLLLWPWSAVPVYENGLANSPVQIHVHVLKSFAAFMCFLRLEILRLRIRLLQDYQLPIELAI